MDNHSDPQTFMGKLFNTDSSKLSSNSNTANTSANVNK
jgi:hypothetical protein